MGLDNGLFVKGIDQKDVPSFVRIPFHFNSKNKDHSINFIYMRKCWGIRNDILNLIHGNEQDCSNIDREDIPAIIRIFYKYTDPKIYEDCADSIWTYEEYLPNLIQDIINLEWLYYYWETHPNLEVKFYDSY